MKNETAELYLLRAENELAVANVLIDISNNPELQKNFKLDKQFTFYSSVISHSYYSIFYCAKAILLTEGIETTTPNVHEKTLIAFEKYFVSTGKLDVQLLKVYKQMVLRAEYLLEIFSKEKGKRGKFTYRTLPQANIEPAQDSIKNALLFFKSINKIIRG